MRLNKLFVIFLVISINAIGQSPQQNLDKYWDYRDRFFEKFILDHDPDNLPSGASPNGINLPVTLIDNKLKYGSETPSLLGDYICAMVAEYKLNQINGISTSDTRDKIYRGLNAMNRLDTLAEYYLESNVNLGTNRCTDKTHLNGFFLRTDMDDSFLNYWEENGKSSWSSLSSLDSPYEEYSDPQQDRFDGNQMSQDQVWNYMLGAAMVKSFVIHR